MTTYTVSTLSALKSALNSASGGDTIALRAGDYGTLTLSAKHYSSAVKITSASTSNEAHFDKISLSSVSNITLDHLSLSGSTEDGHGIGTAVRLHTATNVTLQNSTISYFAKGVDAWNDSNLKVLNNTLENISYDGMDIGHSRTVLIDGNAIDMYHSYGDIHRDGIQFYNEGTVAPTSDATVTNNVIRSDNGVTHGIYIGNYDGEHGAANEAYTNFKISGNTIATGQTLGIAIGAAKGVSVTNNIVVQSAEISSTKDVNIPRIMVGNDASNVSLSGNTVLKTPAIAQESNNWTVLAELAGTGSKIVSLSYLKESGTDASDGDVFRFMGTRVGEGWTTSTSVDFSKGDEIILSNYEAGSFHGVSGGNPLVVSTLGDYAALDSLADVKELDQASSKVKASVSGDTLEIDITQSHGTHHLELPGLGHDYLAIL